jgi:hypothetical protein
MDFTTMHLDFSSNKRVIGFPSLVNGVHNQSSWTSEKSTKREKVGGKNVEPPNEFWKSEATKVEGKEERLWKMTMIIFRIQIMLNRLFFIFSQHMFFFHYIFEFTLEGKLKELVVKTEKGVFCKMSEM